ncbi:DUF1599 domain-containing protein [Candidatus Nomurabacteria bacterium]|nr:DUF1599 domain-containing protein [Candidatus Nomurabacteria bacterium]
MKNKTEESIKLIGTEALAIFEAKNSDYGTSFAHLRPPSMTDQLFIKIKRVRTIENNNGNQKVEDARRDDMLGIINYTIMGIMLLEQSEDTLSKIKKEALIVLYKKIRTDIETIRLNKNHDYGEAWRDMRIPSITDQIYSKIHRIKAIEENGGKVSVSEGIKPLYNDIVNYAFFWIILWDQKHKKQMN